MLRSIRTTPSLKGSYLLHQFPLFGTITLVSFSTSTPKISIFDCLVDRQNFSPQCAANASASSPSKFLRKPQNGDSVLKFFTEAGLSKTQIEAVVQRSPSVLSARLESSIKPKFNVFLDLGFRSSDVADIFSAFPWLLNRSSNTLGQSILGLKNVLGPDVDILRLVKKSENGRILIDFRSKVVPNIEYLKSCGICPLRIAEHVCKHSRPYHSDTETFKGYVKRVDELGVPRESKMFLYAIKVICSMTRKNWELKLKLLRDLGFSEQNILHAFRVSPPAFAVSRRKIKEATQVLLTVTDISYIVSNPQLFSYSVEKRLKPRLRVLKALESKNLLNGRPSLTFFLQMTDAKFIDKYVSPYSEEVGDLYVGKQCS